MRRANAIPSLIFLVILGAGLLFAYSLKAASNATAGLEIAVASLLLAVICASATKIASQWERSIVLRLGRFQSMRGPGLFFIIPIVDTIPYWIDIRVITSTFKAEKTLTKDTVPVDVDAVLFWKVLDPKKAALDVADY
jgi:regulator of protease activity HflC (stomatin/prohibitin superfamily)